MKVLFVSAEVVPFSKTGGLADVALALPKALQAEGVDIRIMTPRNFHNKAVDVVETKILDTEVEVGWRKQYCGITSTNYEGLEVYFVDNEYYFKREGIYGHYDDGERYSFFCRSVLEALCHLDFQPDIIHFNDWHTAMIPLLMKKHYGHVEKFKKIKTVMTIHNLKYQGIFDPVIMKELLNLDDEAFESGAIEFYGCVNFMKSGISFADSVTTVSQTYASEIMEPFYGEKLHDLLRENESKVMGIVNGIDYQSFDPETDPRIVQNYSYKNSSKKLVNKRYLQDLAGFKKNNQPVIAMIARLADQKGLDLVAHILEELLGEEIQVVILGTGDEKYENMLRHYSHHYQNMYAYIGFDETLAQKIYAGADMFLMPSQFEPCGLSQMISQKYGTLPIVRETGGLKDTVEAYNKFTGEGTGFSFESYNAHEMLFAIKRAMAVYEDKKQWRTLVKRVMQLDNSWDQSARQYMALYKGLIEK